jgi:hypothetical protein
MSQLWNDYQPLVYWGEPAGAGVTAFSVQATAGLPANPPQAQGQAPFDQPPDISTLTIGSGATFTAGTDQLDWFRLVALAVGVVIGWKLLK